MTCSLSKLSLRTGRGALILLGAIALAGCGSSAASSVAATATPTLAPASAQFTFAGNGAAVGAMQVKQVECGEPTLTGPEIRVSGLAPGGSPATGISIVITVQSYRFVVDVSTGSGASFVSRTFFGPALTSFNPTKGFTANSAPLSEEGGNNQANPFGVITSANGSVDCGNQVAGSSTIAITGDVGGGALTAPLDSVHVTCYTSASGNYVVVEALGKSGTTPVSIIVSIAADRVTLSAYSGGPAGHYFTLSSPGSGIGKITATGGHADADVPEQVQAGAPAGLTVHISGDATCGSTLASPF